MIDSNTKLVGLIGWPVSHSMSPMMHNSAFQNMKLNFIYVALPVKPERLPEAIKGIKALSFRGVNVTIPHKEKVINYVDDLTKEAELIGAVNTIVSDGERLVGHNTDGVGFIQSLIQNEFNPEGCNALILGAGGAARAVTVALALNRAEKIFICNRTQKKAQQLEYIINKIRPGLASVVEYMEENLFDLDVDIVINTTSIGMYPDVEDCPITNAEFFKEKMVVCDIVYNPLKTAFLKKAESKGCKVIYGLDMLLYQGVEAFKLWTGIEPPIKTMKKMLENARKSRNL